MLDGRALCVTEITPEQFYDFDAKYKAGGSHHILPADIPKEIETQALDWAEQAYHLLGCRGVARADYRYDDKKNSYTCWKLTQPGMTATSLVPEQARWRAEFQVKSLLIIYWRLRNATINQHLERKDNRAQMRADHLDWPIL